MTRIATLSGTSWKAYGAAQLPGVIVYNKTISSNLGYYDLLTDLKANTMYRPSRNIQLIVNLTIATGFIVANNTSNYSVSAFNIVGLNPASGSVINLIVNGGIYGRSGNGAKGTSVTSFNGSSIGYSPSNGGAGSNALLINEPTITVNISGTGFIGGGGGGGAGGSYSVGNNGGQSWIFTAGSGGGGGQGQLSVNISPSGGYGGAAGTVAASIIAANYGWMNGNAGTNGSVAAAGTGGATVYGGAGGQAGYGGNGGSFGQAGAPGDAGYNFQVSPSVQASDSVAGAAGTSISNVATNSVKATINYINGFNVATQLLGAVI